MRVHPTRELLLQSPPNEVFEDYSSPSELLVRLHEREAENLPEEFFDVACLREPEDNIVFKVTDAEFDVRTWREEEELRDEDFHQESFSDIPNGTVPVAEFEDIIDKEHRSIVSHEYGACSNCNDTPEWECRRCEGKEILECEECSGAGSSPCSECEDGDVVCPECGGDSSLPCGHCDGGGSLVVEDGCPNCSGGVIQVEETCSQCQGKGKIREGDEYISCPHCSSGFLSTGGNVNVDKICPECQGRGGTRRRVTCPDCEGRQTQDCNECDTTGLIPCHSCSGRGHIPCTRCEETGVNDCPNCDEGITTCECCEGDGKTHSIVIRRTFIRADENEHKHGKMPYGIDDPPWQEVEPFYLEFETKAGTTIPAATTEIDIDAIDDDTYVRLHTRFVAVREVTYDYGEQNFTVREADGNLYYSRYPEPESPGLFEKIRSLF